MQRSAQQVGDLADGRARGVHRRQHLAGRPDQRLSGRAQAQSAARAMKQRRPELALERPQRLRERGLGHVQSGRSARHGALVNDREKAAQPPLIHRFTL